MFFFAGYANAGVFDSVFDWFKGDETWADTRSFECSSNLQTVSVLQAVNNPNPVEPRGGGDINIVNKSALLADVGPLGSLADINENQRPSERISLYVVRKGDSLSEIAGMFNVSVNTIMWSNDIVRADLIKEGQTLAILPVTGVSYTVKKGDTLVSIAKKFKGDEQEILNYNGLVSAGDIETGMEIIIPDGELVQTAVVSAPGSSPKTYVSDKNTPSYSGYYIRPVQGPKTQGIHGYNGVDLADYCGAPIIASASGDVLISRSSGWNGGYGKYIVLSHPNGTQTLYAHNSSNIVSSGWHVVKGQVIGYVGSTGKSTGCHVHFEIRGAKNPF
jgi:murein DD-endopeptidase MepM/ murein hydrolase activator NlpD